jgi:hypothetical protein
MPNEDKQAGPGLYVKLGLNVDGMLGGVGGVAVVLNQTLDLFGKFEAAAQKIVDLANNAMELQSTVDKLTVTTGLSSTELYKWSNVAKYADSDINSLSSMLRKLSINMAESGESGDKARAMLAAMNVSIKNADGSTRSMNEIFPEVIEGLKGVGDTGTRNTVAMALFGKSFQELSGYMLMSKGEMQGYFNDGWAPTEAQSQKLRDYEQALKDLNTTTTNLSLQGGAAMSGSIREWTELMDDVLKAESPVMKFFEKLDDFLTLSARGFHIMGQEALVAWQFAHGDITGAKATADNLMNWINNEQRGDANRAAGFKTDKNGNIVLDEKSNVPPLAPSISPTESGTDWITKLRGGGSSGSGGGTKSILDTGVTFEDLADAYNGGKITQAEFVSWGYDLKNAVDASTPASVLAWNQFANGGTNYDAINPASDPNHAASMQANALFYNPALGEYASLDTTSKAAALSNSFEDRFRWSVGAGLGQSSNFDDQAQAMLDTISTLDYSTKQYAYVYLDAAKSLMEQDAKWQPITGNISIVINQDNSGSPSNADEIAAATAQAISRALAKQIGG